MWVGIAYSAYLCFLDVHYGYDVFSDDIFLTILHLSSGKFTIWTGLYLIGSVLSCYWAANWQNGLAILNIVLTHDVNGLSHCPVRLTSV